jgi:very-short-patch-repair endonuclease
MPSEKQWKTTPENWNALKPRAREFRTAPTPAENHLWQRLRNRQLDGFKFRRQHVIGRFVVDFYCAEASLIIEIDGSVHDGQQERDADRQQWLELSDFQVLRFRNEQILNEIESVLQALRAALGNPLD